MGIFSSNTSFSLSTTTFVLNTGKGYPARGRFVFCNGLGRTDRSIVRVKSGLANRNRNSSRRVVVSLSGIPTGVREVTFAIAVCSTRTEHRGFKRISGSCVHLMSRSGRIRLVRCSLKRSFSVRATMIMKRLCERGKR